jgi:stage II sporulation protein AB (anti-sigma F factor)
MSVGGPANLNLSYDAVPASVPAARRAVAAFAHAAGATREELDTIRLAVSEGVTNVVMHAYRGGSGRVHVSAAIASAELWVLIADDGSGLQTGTHSTGLGVGLALISEITDGFAIVKRSGGGTEVRMRFVLAEVELPAQAQSAPSRASASSPATSSFSTTR